MGIQSSVNSLLSQAQSLAAFYKGFEKAGDLIKGQEDIVKGQEAQTEATQNLQKTFEERYRKRLKLPDDAVLRPSQQEIVNLGTNLEEKLGHSVPITTVAGIHMRNQQLQVENMVAQMNAKSRVSARTDSINQAKSDFNAHTASLIKYYSKGSGNP